MLWVGGDESGRPSCSLISGRRRRGFGFLVEKGKSQRIYIFIGRISVLCVGARNGWKRVSVDESENSPFSRSLRVIKVKLVWYSETLMLMLSARVCFELWDENEVWWTGRKASYWLLLNVRGASRDENYANSRNPPSPQSFWYSNAISIHRRHSRGVEEE